MPFDIIDDIQPDILRKFIQACKCPWCDNQKKYRTLANHTYQKHGITAFELREMAGLNRCSSICDFSSSELRACRARQRPQNILLTQLAKGRTPEASAARSKTLLEEGLRKEGYDNRVAVSSTPEHIALFKKVTSSKESRAKQALVAQNRFPEVVKAQTERVQLAQQRHMKKNPGFWRDKGKRLASNLTPEQRKRAANTCSKVIPLYHANPEWKESWREKTIIGANKRSKIKRNNWSDIISRFQNGESIKEIALSYNVTPRYIRRLTTGK